MDLGLSLTKDFFASPALSLSLAGVFRNAAQAEEEVDEGEAVEISSENTGPGRSEDERETDGTPEEDGDVGDKRKKRKRYHRHTAEQIREMEALFKESPHPDEKQRQQLSKQLGLAPQQVKFWFQNRRTQIKAIQERHENSLLKSEIEKLREENRSMRETIYKSCCPNCGSATNCKDPTMTTNEQQLRIENAKLKAEIEKLRGALGKVSGITASPSSSCSAGNEHDSRSSLEYYSGFFGLEKSRILEIVNLAMDEFVRMATAHEPLWVRSVETGREILNYDEYLHEFSPEKMSKGPVRRSVEVSRETGIVLLDASSLMNAFMDVKQWKDLFPCMISKAATVDVISGGEGNNKNGLIQLMFAELQMLTPMVPTREVYFMRCCKQQTADSWAIVDVSIDEVEDNIDASLVKCRKRPSGCIIEEKPNGHCKVTWVEHVECQICTIPTIYRSIVNTGLAFGARHWMATLQQQCERLVFFMATNVPNKDSSGVSTLAGRKSILKLAQRMTCTFCRAVGTSSYNTWTKVSTKSVHDIRISSRKNLNDPGEPNGVILCAVSSIWLPVSSMALFEFLRDGSRRSEWDVMLTGGPLHTIAKLAKGQGGGNLVTVHHATQSKESGSKWLLQDSCNNAYESMLVYAPVDVTRLQSAMTGCDSSNIAILPSGFSILPDGPETRPLVISSRLEERTGEGGSVLTAAFQILADVSPKATLSLESIDTLNTLISCTLQNIKTNLQCEDG